ncbi:hypothetical protein cyc_05466 [Cyclospora cayetanensis]|uniref:Uncharacterized protein n=1 Tax=Cyclospora cayetanensis TaxID=88456 RepID=A0A1D3DB50_9EIME|nr:hypothetical protein cyc_05466 [Cyclospora cayetanensis]
MQQNPPYTDYLLAYDCIATCGSRTTSVTAAGIGATLLPSPDVGEKLVNIRGSGPGNVEYSSTELDIIKKMSFSSPFLVNETADCFSGVQTPMCPLENWCTGFGRTLSTASYATISKEPFFDAQYKLARGQEALSYSADSSARDDAALMSGEPGIGYGVGPIKPPFQGAEIVLTAGETHAEYSMEDMVDYLMEQLPLPSGSQQQQGDSSIARQRSGVSQAERRVKASILESAVTGS